ncbi:MAG: methylated-DNA--[protein]-cysteine S-methyltransferase [Actinomycetota bacterium]
MYREIVHSRVGPWTVEGDDHGIAKIYSPHEAPSSGSAASVSRVREASRQLAEYFRGRRTDFDIVFHQRGTDFHKDVWSAIAKIPFGEVRSYGDLAIEIGRPQAYRAVGSACNRNPWPVVIPCHRVVAASSMGGYGGGLAVKRFLLELEGFAWPEE